MIEHKGKGSFDDAHETLKKELKDDALGHTQPCSPANDNSPGRFSLVRLDDDDNEHTLAQPQSFHEPELRLLVRDKEKRGKTVQVVLEVSNPVQVHDTLQPKLETTEDDFTPNDDAIQADESLSLPLNANGEGRLLLTLGQVTGVKSRIRIADELVSGECEFRRQVTIKTHCMAWPDHYSFPQSSDANAQAFGSSFDVFRLVDAYAPLGIDLEVEDGDALAHERFSDKASLRELAEVWDRSDGEHADTTLHLGFIDTIQTAAPSESLPFSWERPMGKRTKALPVAGQEGCLLTFSELGADQLNLPSDQVQLVGGTWSDAQGEKHDLPLEWVTFEGVRLNLKSVTNLRPFGQDAVFELSFNVIPATTLGIQIGGTRGTFISVRRADLNESKGSALSFGEQLLATVIHELAHSFGLVSTDHPDANPNPEYDTEHEAHCRNTDCVMYYAADDESDSEESGTISSLSFCKTCELLVRARDLDRLPVDITSAYVLEDELDYSWEDMGK